MKCLRPEQIEMIKRNKATFKAKKIPNKKESMGSDNSLDLNGDNISSSNSREELNENDTEIDQSENRDKFDESEFSFTSPRTRPFANSFFSGTRSL